MRFQDEIRDAESALRRAVTELKTASVVFKNNDMKETARKISDDALNVESVADGLKDFLKLHKEA